MASQNAGRAPRSGGQAPVPDSKAKLATPGRTGAAAGLPGATGHPAHGIPAVAGAGQGQHAARGGGPTGKKSVSGK